MIQLMTHAVMLLLSIGQSLSSSYSVCRLHDSDIETYMTNISVLNNQRP